jgi:hypothetical protein
MVGAVATTDTSNELTRLVRMVGSLELSNDAEPDAVISWDPDHIYTREVHRHEHQSLQIICTNAIGDL